MYNNMLWQTCNTCIFIIHNHMVSSKYKIPNPSYVPESAGIAGSVDSGS